MYLDVLPRGSYPTPFLGYLVLWLGSVILKRRRPKKGVGYEPPGIPRLSAWKRRPVIHSVSLASDDRSRSSSSSRSRSSSSSSGLAMLLGQSKIQILDLGPNAENPKP